MVNVDHVGLRAVMQEDQVLLLEVYGHTRAEELELVPEWSETQKQAFIQHQFLAQDTYYKQVYPDADYQIILYAGNSAGRLYVERNLIPGTIRIIDIALLPAYRNLGIGSHLIRRLQDEARLSNKTLSIHVEHFNRARLLYEHLGFKAIRETHGVYIFMEWTP